jgi:hypothetical protein
MPAMWALGWTATTLGGIHVEEQFTIFGAYGALAFSAVSGALLHQLLPYRDTTQGPPTTAAAVAAAHRGVRSRIAVRGGGRTSGVVTVAADGGLEK